MDIFTLTISLGLILMVLLLILHPLWQATHLDHRPPRRVDQILNDYQIRYEATLANIRQLMFDYEAGKILTEDYEKLLQQAKLQAAEIRQHLDYYREGVPAATEFALGAKIEMMLKQLKPETFSPNLQREVQAEIHRLKQQRPPTGLACSHCGQGYQQGDAFCTRCGQALHSCPHCQHPVQPTDTFCAKCGTALQEGGGESS